MACRVIDFSNPYFWVFLSSFFLGLTVAQATIFPEKRGNPYRTRKWKWVWVYIFLSLFIGSGVIGFFAAGWQSFLYLEMIWYGAAVTGLAGLGFRFKKAIGIPLVLVLIGFTVYFSMMTSPFRCLPVKDAADRELGWFRMLDEEEGHLRIETENEETTIITDLPGRSATPVVSVLEISKHYILYGGMKLYLFHGIYTDENAFISGEQPENRFLEGESVINIDKVRRFADRFSCVNLISYSVSPFLPVPFQRYNIFLEEEPAAGIRTEVSF